MLQVPQQRAGYHLVDITLEALVMEQYRAALETEIFLHEIRFPLGKFLSSARGCVARNLRVAVRWIDPIL
jgi:hypothetical protein